MAAIDRLKGSVPPLATPFRNGEVDYEAYARIIEFHIKSGTHGILVNGIAPGLIDTGFDPLSEEAKRAHAASLPLGRLGLPDDLVGAFVFLAADEGRYFCGQTLHPNGGEIMP